MSIATGWAGHRRCRSLAWPCRHVQVGRAPTRDPPGIAVLLGKIVSAYSTPVAGTSAAWGKPLAQNDLRLRAVETSLPSERKGLSLDPGNR